MNSQKRKAIAKSFISANFGWCGELWRNYDALDEKGQPKSWCPIPCLWLHTSRNTDPIIGVAETHEEAEQIVKLELPEDRWDKVEYETFTYVDGKEYHIIID